MGLLILENLSFRKVVTVLRARRRRLHRRPPRGKRPLPGALYGLDLKTKNHDPPFGRNNTPHGPPGPVLTFRARRSSRPTLGARPIIKYPCGKGKKKVNGTGSPGPQRPENPEGTRVEPSSLRTFSTGC